MLLFFVAALVLRLPGHVPYDGIAVWHEAKTGKLYAQHPAALVLVLRPSPEVALSRSRTFL